MVFGFRIDLRDLDKGWNDHAFGANYVASP